MISIQLFIFHSFHKPAYICRCAGVFLIHAALPFTSPPPPPPD